MSVSERDKHTYTYAYTGRQGDGRDSMQRERVQIARCLSLSFLYLLICLFCKSQQELQCLHSSRRSKNVTRMCDVTIDMSTAGRHRRQWVNIMFCPDNTHFICIQLCIPHMGKAHNIGMSRVEKIDISHFPPRSISWMFQTQYRLSMCKKTCHNLL